MPHHHSNTYSLSSAHPPFFFNANPNHLPGVDDSPPLVDHLAVPLGWDGAASDALNSFAQSPLETTSSSTATTPNTQMIDTAFQSLDLLSPPPQDTYFGFPFAYSDVDDNQYFLSNYTSLPEHQVAKSEPLPLSTLLYEDIVASPVCSIPSTPIVPASSVAEVSLTSPQADLSDVSSSDSHTSSSFDSCTIRPSSLPTRWTSEAPRPPLTRRAYSQRSDGPTIRRRSFNNHTVLPVSNIFWNSTKFEVDAQLGSPSAQLRWIVSSATAAAAPKLATIDGQSSDENAPTRKRKRQPSSGEVEPASAATAPQKSVLHPPKLAPSTWQIFFTEQLQLIKLKSPDQKLNVAHAAKDLAQVYKNMSAEEKEPYKRKSQQAKQERERQLAAWQRTLTPGDVRAENAFRSAQRRGGKSRKANMKDPNAPKKPLSAYFMFLQTIRASPELVSEVFGDETGTTIQSQLAAQKWRSLSEDEKRPFLLKAEQAKVEYDIEKKRYEDRFLGFNTVDDSPSSGHYLAFGDEATSSTENARASSFDETSDEERGESEEPLSESGEVNWA